MSRRRENSDVEDCTHAGERPRLEEFEIKVEAIVPRLDGVASPAECEVHHPTAGTEITAAIEEGVFGRDPHYEAPKITSIVAAMDIALSNNTTACSHSGITVTAKFSGFL